MFFKKRERKRGNFGENRRKGERILVGFSGFRGPTRRRAISGSALIARSANSGRSPGCGSEGFPVSGRGWLGLKKVETRLMIGVQQLEFSNTFLRINQHQLSATGQTNMS
jgi:hypothetical protein